MGTKRVVTAEDLERLLGCPLSDVSMDLRGADLTGADLSRANLTCAKLLRANLTGAKVIASTRIRFPV